MKNTFGNAVSVTVFGESHGPAVGAVLDGLAPGIPLDEELMARQMGKRKNAAHLSTARREPDQVKILSGAYQGKTTGTPLTLVIENTDTRSQDYEKTAQLLRPGHADMTALSKYHGFADPRGGGHFSGRITAGLVAAGAVCLKALELCGITLGTHIAACGGIVDRAFEPQGLEEQIKKLNLMEFAVLDPQAGEKMKQRILEARQQGDSVGGILETCVLGLPAGVGEPWFDTVEGVLSHLLFSVGGVKGVEFGAGFAVAELTGSTNNDAFYLRNGQIATQTNRCGGILGGITNGMPLTLRCAVKPTPSIFKEQSTVNAQTMENATLQLEGRHDPAIVHRARVVVDSLVAIGLCDLLSQRYGTDFPFTLNQKEQR